jgi:hypothetical protein
MTCGPSEGSASSSRARWRSCRVPLAAQLIASGDFELVSTGPLAKVLVLRIGQDTIPSPDAAPLTRAEAEGAADFEAELEEEERRFDAAAADREDR